MSKGIILLAAALALTFSQAQAQTQAVVDSLSQDNADFTFTESQLDEDNDAAQTVSNIQGNDPYLSEVGYAFSAMRFKVRALDNQYNQTYINGLQMFDTESGRFNYSSVGGLNDATRNKEGIGFGQVANYGISDVGGAQSINMRASQIAAGSKLSVSACNRNYVGRVMFTHATGYNKNGWAFAGSAGYRGAPMGWGNVDGTFYNSFSYFLSAQKRINPLHEISLVTYGAPTERAQQGASTEEVYALANSHYYNSNWGYQGGKKRSARVVNSFDPTAIFTWDWKSLDGTKKVTTNAGFHYSMYASSALGWSGDAYDPRPDYYKNLPSSIFDVYDPTKNNAQYLEENPHILDQWNYLYNYWTSDEAHRQINWDRMYYVNRQNGGEALYYMENRHNDQMTTALSSTFNHSVDTHNKYALGVQLNTTKGMHYKTMNDLMGAQYYTDIDKFASNDYGAGSPEAQNDLLHPNRRIQVGDTFGYNYNVFVHKARLWGQYEHNNGPWYAAVSGHLDGTIMEREGLMQNGRYVDYSYGKSGAAKFLSGGAKVTVAWSPNPNHRIQLTNTRDSRAPEARNSFVAPHVQNNYVNNLKVEQIMSTELSYKFVFGKFSGKVGGYHAYFKNGVEQTTFYNDQQSTFTYLTMSGVDRRHYGVEAAFNLQVTSSLSFHLLGTYGEAKYISNPYAQLNPEGSDGKEIAKLNTYQVTHTLPDNTQLVIKDDLCVVADGMRVGGTPLTAVTLGVKYNVSGWFFQLNANYYDRVYLAFSPYQRLNTTYATAGKVHFPVSGNQYDVTKAEMEREGGILYDNNGRIVASYAKEQEKFKGGFMLDASIGKYIRMRHGKSLSINLSLQNITNNTKMRTGGYEQNRDDFYYTESGGQYTKGEGKAYSFSHNPKYYYAFPFNFFLNIGFKF